ncbi:MAG: ABC transporter substrate-binding protein [Spirochaetae bacterium HGW-Spirochaetae-3]|jgi:NitT/TauT family transport system substrate-binding protein|nr:MAG: ABC transporter substrate-binding protein [Spirochaetae bacterium HGW-Spirochaetae-3]
MKFMKPIAVVAALAAIVSISCAPKQPAEPLRLGIMPDADSLPFLVAESEGLFEKNGVAVELVAFANPQERDAAIQAGRLDGAISDVLAAAFLVAGGFDMRVTSATDGRYGIVAAPGSGIVDARGLTGKRIGLSTNSIIQYSVDAITEAAGLASDAITPVAIPKMPVRMEMLLAGQVDAAGLPEPFLTTAVQRGASLVGTTEQFHIDAAVIVFSEAVLDARLPEVKNLYRAYAAAAARINADPESYRAFLVEKAKFPAEAKDAYAFVTYRKPTLPASEQVAAAVSWLDARGLLSRSLSPEDLLDGRAVAAW